jgi:glutamine kinase
VTSMSNVLTSDNGKDFQFGTKAETLLRISDILKRSKTLELIIVHIGEWLKNSDKCIDVIQHSFGERSIAVRSSAKNEDNNINSRAGEYMSILHVSCADRLEISDAINAVKNSYIGRLTSNIEEEHILVQEMARDVDVSGVVFTQELNTGSPYYVINYDDISGRTDTVTSGSEGGNQTLFVNRNSIERLSSTRFISLLMAVKEIEQITGYRELDIEFTIDKTGTVYILQIRSITTQKNWNRHISISVNSAISQIEEFVSNRFRRLPGICGKTTLFGEMSDWNPVEMIGTSPRPLAASLYRYLITDSTWRKARGAMGYDETSGQPLMCLLGGKPFIDIRLSFNSFLPTSLPHKTKEKLVTAWIEILKENPHLHDKIEFDVAITALTFDFDAIVDKRTKFTLSQEEKDNYKNCLRTLTNDLLIGRIAPISKSLMNLELMEHRREVLCSNTTKSNLATAKTLLEDCLQYGAYDFSILARHAFIGQAILRSLVSKNVISEDDINAFGSSIETITSIFTKDIRSLGHGDHDIEVFLKSYGHLRPGTYDITSLRYDQRRDRIKELAERSTTTITEEQSRSFKVDASTRQQIKNELKRADLTISVNGLFKYMEESTVAREYGKFLFTKNLSEALEIIAAWGELNGLSRDELSFIPISELFDSNSVTAVMSREEKLRQTSRDKMEEHKVSMAIRLPYLVRDISDIYVVPMLLSKPSFITSKSILSDIVLVSGSDIGSNISGKIVAIESADPGFDWIFACSIGGLMTKFGGTNSHMAIRCAEFNIPAAIGCGEQIFSEAMKSKSVEIKCDEGSIRFQ